MNQPDIIVAERRDADDFERHHQCPVLAIDSPGLGGRKSVPDLEQLDRDVVGGADERHVPVARRAVDGDPAVHEPLAGLVDIVDRVSEMAEIAAFAIAAFVPIMRQFDLRLLVAGRGEEDQREASRLIIEAPDLLEAEQVEKADASRPGPKRGSWCGGISCA